MKLLLPIVLCAFLVGCQRESKLYQQDQAIRDRLEPGWRTLPCSAGLQAQIDGAPKAFNTIAATVSSGGTGIQANTGVPTEYLNFTVSGLLARQTGTFQIPRNRAQFIDASGNTFNSLDGQAVRSEERRVGKECRSRWSPYH